MIEGRREKVFLFLLGVVMAVDSLWGLFATMMFGFDSLNETILAICFWVPFPIYLLVLHSALSAEIGVWLLFFATWITRCFISTPPEFISPWMMGLPYAVFLVAISLTYVRIMRGGRKEEAIAY